MNKNMNQPGHVDVYVRTMEGDRAAVAPFPLTELDEVVRTLGAWGVIGDGDATDELFGQFFVQNGVFGFEVIVGDE
jgi:hypothetical protein